MIETNCPKCSTVVQPVMDNPWPYYCDNCGAIFKTLALEGNIFKVHQDDVAREKIIRDDVMYIVQGAERAAQVRT